MLFVELNWHTSKMPAPHTRTCCALKCTCSANGDYKCTATMPKTSENIAHMLCQHHRPGQNSFYRLYIMCTIVCACGQMWRKATKVRVVAYVCAILHIRRAMTRAKKPIYIWAIGAQHGNHIYAYRAHTSPRVWANAALKANTNGRTVCSDSGVSANLRIEQTQAVHSRMYMRHRNALGFRV